MFLLQHVWTALFTGSENSVEMGTKLILLLLMFYVIFMFVLTLKMWFYSFGKKKKKFIFECSSRAGTGSVFPGSNLLNPPTHVTLTDFEEESREWH